MDNMVAADDIVIWIEIPHGWTLPTGTAKVQHGAIGL
eukprot:SAG31_NODE_1404_length_8479_cov_2.258760_3_plen_37_part_00